MRASCIPALCSALLGPLPLAATALSFPAKAVRVVIPFGKT
jgi:hypothetical protein